MITSIAERRTFQLTSRPRVRQADPEVVPSPKRVLNRFLAIPRWDANAIQAAERAIEFYWVRVTDCVWFKYRTSLQDDETEALIVSAERAIKEWKRLQTATTLPTTAWLNRKRRVERREDRVVALYNRIQARIAGREDSLRLKMKQFKTAKAQTKEEKRVYSADRSLQRLNRHVAWMESIQPNIGWMAQCARSKAS